MYGNLGALWCGFVAQCSFGAKQSRSQLDSHRVSKHDKLTFEQCFPTYKETAEAVSKKKNNKK